MLGAVGAGEQALSEDLIHQYAHAVVLGERVEGLGSFRWGQQVVAHGKDLGAHDVEES